MGIQVNGFAGSQDAIAELLRRFKSVVDYACAILNSAHTCFLRTMERAIYYLAQP